LKIPDRDIDAGEIISEKLALAHQRGLEALKNAPIKGVLCHLEK
jgi:hypothetical protein